MDPTLLARWQFAITTLYHFLFVPLTLGLGLVVAILESMHYRSKVTAYREAASFWGRLFAINFAMGVATGIVQEFQFGMNWSEYSRFVGDIFGIPLAIEALLAFFMESTFLGLYLFGRDKLPPAIHLATAWLVIIGATLSSLWILIANSWMQEPVGYQIVNGRAEMTDFFATMLSAHVWVQFPHVIFGGWITGGMFVMGISAWHLLQRHRMELFGPSFRIGLLLTAVAALASATSGHEQAQHTATAQPMKLAAMEALWETEQPASFSLFSVIDQGNQQSLREIKLPTLLSVLAFNNTTAEVRGMNDLQREYEQKYGPGNYLPPVAETYWAFRVMVGLGMLFIGLAMWGLWLWWRNGLEQHTLFLRLCMVAMFLPYLANSSGWMVTELGRQPWIVQGLMRTVDGVSPNVSAPMVLVTMLGFTVLYAVLAIADVYLLRKYALMGADGRPAPRAVKELGGVHAY
jgi:cytochrome bd ubiquinol oxidase subunit I